VTGGADALTLDHVAFGAGDLDAAMQAFAALGFTPSAASRCEWTIAGRTSSAAAACVVFPGEYLDLVEVPGASWRAHLESSLVYARGFAPTGIVLSGLDPGRAHAALAAADPVALAPYPITRRIAGEPAAEIAYEFLPLPRGGLPFGLISDSSPALLRRPAWLAHPNGTLGIAGLHLRVPSLAEAVAALAGPPLSLARQSDAPAVLSLGAARLELHERPQDAFLASVSERLPEREHSALLALEFRVASLEVAERVLCERGVRFAEGPRGLCVDPEQGYGTGIVLR
jgi:hypothetical protein